MKILKSAGGVVIGPDGKVLVVAQRNKVWSLPKGCIEPDETELEAARREIREETGIDQLELIKKLGEYERYRIGLKGDDRSVLKKITIFLFNTEQSYLKPENKTEHPEAKWVDIDKVVQTLTNKKDQKFFRSIQPKIKMA